MFENYPDIVDIGELQKMLNIGRTLAYRLLKSQRIKNIKVGRSYRISKSHVIDYISEFVDKE